MSDQNFTPPFDPDAFMARWHAHEKRAAELHPANKASLFSALQCAGISRVAVRFDGVGDSGQIEDVEAFAGEATVELPENISIEIVRLHFGEDEPERLTEPLREAVETLAYAFLEQTHAGWENNEGAYGDFEFDVAEGTITLDYNERVETSNHHFHQF